MSNNLSRGFTDQERGALRSFQNEFALVQQRVNEFDGLLFSSSTTILDEYPGATLLKNPEGLYVFNGFGRTLVGRPEFSYGEGIDGDQWFARIVFYDLQYPIAGPAQSTPAYSFSITVDSHIWFPHNRAGVVMPGQYRSENGSFIFNRLKADLLLVAKELSTI